ncbi:unnamed protein product [Closterium sp. NIES-64]|nr:unnamed protein product [Closterium sp. NIES-64]
MESQCPCASPRVSRRSRCCSPLLHQRGLTGGGIEGVVLSRSVGEPTSPTLPYSSSSSLPRLTTFPPPLPPPPPPPPPPPQFSLSFYLPSPTRMGGPPFCP